MGSLFSGDTAPGVAAAAASGEEKTFKLAVSTASLSAYRCSFRDVRSSQVSTGS